MGSLERTAHATQHSPKALAARASLHGPAHSRVQFPFIEAGEPGQALLPSPSDPHHVRSQPGPSWLPCCSLPGELSLEHRDRQVTTANLRVLRLPWGILWPVRTVSLSPAQTSEGPEQTGCFSIAAASPEPSRARLPSQGSCRRTPRATRSRADGCRFTGTSHTRPHGHITPAPTCTQAEGPGESGGRGGQSPWVPHDPGPHGGH